MKALSFGDVGSYVSVLHMTLGGDNKMYGDRAPAVWFDGDKLQVHNAISGDKDHKYSHQQDMLLNQWHSVEVSSNVC